LLRDPRVDPSACGQEALFEACRHGRLQVVERLLRDERTNPKECEHGWPIVLAARTGNEKLVARLMHDERIDPSAGGHQTAIRTAAWHGRGLVVDCLLNDDRVASDTATLRQCIQMAHERGHACVAYFLEDFCAWRARNAGGE